ncbi:hypothetical protein ACP3TJ_08000 [Desulforudis sp. 1088]|uniref:hypothetical protein n=1 Tax=unclassified Candidatus Desulforudis TaxID=2635950 RepID=UPI003CE4BD39
MADVKRDKDWMDKDVHGDKDRDVEKRAEDDPNYLGRAWEATKEAVGLDKWTDAKESEKEEVQ